MKVLGGAFNQEKALIGAFSVIVKTNGSFAALILTLCNNHHKSTHMLSADYLQTLAWLQNCRAGREAGTAADILVTKMSGTGAGRGRIRGRGGD